MKKHFALFMIGVIIVAVVASALMSVPTAAQAPPQGRLVVTDSGPATTSQSDVSLYVVVGWDLSAAPGGPGPVQGASVGFFVGGQVLSAVTDSSGRASVSYHFSAPGSVPVTYKVNKPPYQMIEGSFTTTYNGPSSNAKLDLAGPSTGTAGDILTYTVTATPPRSMMVQIEAIGPEPGNRLFSGQTNALGIATIAVPFTTAGEYHIMAGSMDYTLGYLSNSMTVTIAAKSDNNSGASGGGSSGGSNSNGGGSGSGASPTGAAPTTRTSTTNASLLDVSGADTAGTSGLGAIWWLFALGAIILVAAVLAVYWWSRREQYGEGATEAYAPGYDDVEGYDDEGSTGGWPGGRR